LLAINAKPCRGSALRKNTECDVCIVGGGLAGMSIAYQLVKAGASVVVLEAKRFGEGETGRTSAHLVTALDRRYADLRACHGAERTRLIAVRDRSAIDIIERIASEEGIDCDFRRCAGYLVSTSKDGPDVVRQEDEAARDAGLVTEWRETSGYRRSPTCLAFASSARLSFILSITSTVSPPRFDVGEASCITERG